MGGDAITETAQVPPLERAVDQLPGLAGNLNVAGLWHGGPLIPAGQQDADASFKVPVRKTKPGICQRVFIYVYAVQQIIELRKKPVLPSVAQSVHGFLSLPAPAILFACHGFNAILRDPDCSKGFLGYVA